MSVEVLIQEQVNPKQEIPQEPDIGQIEDNIEVPKNEIPNDETPAEKPIEVVKSESLIPDPEVNDQQEQKPEKPHEASPLQKETQKETVINNNKTDFSKLEAEYFRKVFVGSLSYSTNEDSLRAYFSKYGELIDSVIMKESKTGKSRGFGFVTYTKSSMVDELQKHRPHKLDGRELETKRATPREESGRPGAESSTNKLFIGAIKDGLTDQNLREYFGKYGTIEDCIIMKDKESNKLRGFGFITFVDYDPVDKIVLEKFHTVNGQSVAVKKALPKDQAGNNITPSPIQPSGANHQFRSGPPKQNGNFRPNRSYNNNSNMYNSPHSNHGYNNYNNYPNNNGNNFGPNHYNGNSYPAPSGSSNANSNGNISMMPNMNMNNFALLAQKMFEAAANNMQAPMSSQGPIPNQFGNGLFEAPFNPNRRPSGMNGQLNGHINGHVNGNMNGPVNGNSGINNRQTNFASDDFEDFDGWSNEKSMNMNGPGPIKGNFNNNYRQNTRNGPYVPGGRRRR